MTLLNQHTRTAAAAAVLLASAALSGCEGDNLFRNEGRLENGVDGSAPSVEIQAPVNSVRPVVGDSVLVTARLSDEQGLAKVELSAFALRADPATGEQQRVERFTPRTIVFDTTAAVRDTSISRVLLALGDTPEAPVFVVASATDRAGNVGADTVAIGVAARPSVQFAVSVPARAEQTDTLRVSVFAPPSASASVAQVGATVVVVRRGPGVADTLRVQTRTAAGRAGTLLFPLDQLGLTPGFAGFQDVSLEVTAFVIDNAGRCFAATEPGTSQSLGCRDGAGGAPVAGQPGAASAVRVLRGRTVRLENPMDRLVDIKSDGERVFVSNFSRNRVEFFPVGATQFDSRGILVGSEPWGIALSPDSSQLFVANSGGTNISRVTIAQGVATGTEDAGRRIQTRNLRVFEIAFDPQTGEPTAVARLKDFSDRPQFIAQLNSGVLLYSTKPTSSAAPGTIRRFNVGLGREELFTGDFEEPRSPLVFSGDSVRFIPGVPADSLFAGIPATIKACTGSRCFQGSATSVANQLLDEDFGAQIGFGNVRPEFADTTYVAVSGDHSTAAFGDGASADRSRLFLFQENSDGLAIETGDTEDIVGNASEKVIGLGLNQDGSVGIARGGQSYVFNDRLRLLGVISTGTPTGGVALNPSQGSCPLTSDPECVAFVSGEDATGAPYIDIVDTFHFCSVGRIFIAQPVTRALAVVPGPAGGPRYRVYGITANGVVAVDVMSEDLTGCR